MKKAVIIDDCPKIRLIVQRVLEKIPDIEIFAADSGLSGLKLIRKQKPNLVILDIMMPDITGLEVLKMMKEDKRIAHIPVIMLTGRTDREALKESMYWYAAEFLTKPVTPAALLEKAIQHLGTPVPR